MASGTRAPFAPQGAGQGAQPGTERGSAMTEKIQERAIEGSRQVRGPPGLRGARQGLVRPKRGSRVDPGRQGRGRDRVHRRRRPRGHRQGPPPKRTPAGCRQRMEIAAARWLAEHAEELADITVRFDLIALMVIDDKRAPAEAPHQRPSDAGSSPIRPIKPLSGRHRISPRGSAPGGAYTEGLSRAAGGSRTPLRRDPRMRASRTCAAASRGASNRSPRASRAPTSSSVLERMPSIISAFSSRL